MSNKSNISIIIFIEKNMAYELSNALKIYLNQRKIIALCTIKLILYKDIIRSLTLIKTIARCLHRVEDIKIKPTIIKLDERTLYNVMFISYFKNDYKDKIFIAYKKWVNNNELKYKINNFEKKY